MPKVSIIDYKRVAGLFRKTITVNIPEELVARKGRTAAGRRRCRLAEQRLTETVHAELEKIGRRAFRSDVAIHLELRGVSLDRPSEATRTVKAILDSMQGPVYSDDRVVALLDVSLQPGPLQAEIAFCSARQYADAFDVLCGVSQDRDDRWCDADDPWPDIVSRDDPWTWDRESPSDECDLEVAEENLAHLEAGNSLLPADLRTRMIEFDRRHIREHKRTSLLSTPYLPTDRPGPPSLAGRLWNDVKHFPSPARIYLPAPMREGGRGSWTATAREAFAAHFGHWREVIPLLQDEPVALDIAIGKEADGSFDVDNLAARVLRAFRESAPRLPSPPAYRVYRRHGDDGAVVVALHTVHRAANLRYFLGGSPLAICGLQPDPDGPVYRRRPMDDQTYESAQALGLAAG
jgi:hypothetical protein